MSGCKVWDPYPGLTGGEGSDGGCVCEVRGFGPELAELAREGLHPVLDSIYQMYGGAPFSEVERALARAGRGAFRLDNIEIFARYITWGDRPVLTH